MAPLKIRKGFVRKREKEGETGATTAEGLPRDPACRAVSRCQSRRFELGGRRRPMSAPSLFAKIRDAALALGRSERTATRKARRLEAASFADFIRLTPEQNVKLGLSPKARHYVLKDCEAHHESDADDQRAPVRNQTRARALQTDARTNDGSAPPWRDSLRIRRPTRAGRQGGDHPRGKQGHRGDQEAPRIWRDGPSNSPDKARHGSSYPISAGARAQLSRHKAAQARWPAHPGWRVALVHRLRPTIKGPPV